MKIVFRLDGNSTMGTGHIMRSCTLAKELAKKADIFFVLSNTSKAIENLISGDIAVKFLPDYTYQYRHGFPFLEEHSVEDAFETKKILTAIGEVDWLIIDHYGIDKRWEKTLKSLVKNIMVIDDLANREHHCDILLDQNLITNQNDRYTCLIPKACRELIGPSYALLRDEFAKKPIREQKESVDTLLISFGGSDPDNFTGRVLHTLISRENLFVNVVMGSASIHRKNIEELCNSYPHFQFHFQINYMAKLMADADVFIGAGGATTWERLAMGVPGIIISIADNQTQICETLEHENLVKYLGTVQDYSDERFIALLDETINDQEWRKNASNKGLRILCGRGAKKVAAHILSYSIILRHAEKEDSENIYEWRNAPVNREFSNNSQTFSLESHANWYAKVIDSNTTSLLIAHLNDKPIGVIRFDYKEDVSRISIYMVPQWHGKGWGLSVLTCAIEWLKNNKTAILKIEAEIVMNNVASKQIFIDAGFIVNKIFSDTEILIKEV